MHLTDVKITAAAEIQTFGHMSIRYVFSPRDFADDKTHVVIVYNSTRTKKILDISNQLVHSQSQYQDYLGKELKKLVEFGN